MCEKGDQTILFPHKDCTTECFNHLETPDNNSSIENQTMLVVGDSQLEERITRQEAPSLVGSNPDQRSLLYYMFLAWCQSTGVYLWCWHGDVKG